MAETIPVEENVSRGEVGAMQTTHNEVQIVSSRCSASQLTAMKTLEFSEPGCTADIQYKWAGGWVFYMAGGGYPEKPGDCTAVSDEPCVLSVCFL